MQISDFVFNLVWILSLCDVLWVAYKRWLYQMCIGWCDERMCQSGCAEQTVSKLPFTV